MKEFVHLHLHTEYSLLDGAARIKKMVKVCKENGMPAVAITDHGNMYGVIAFYDECKKQGIKPIIGCELYITDDMAVKDPKSKYSHLVLLAKNQEGYLNLCKLNTISFKDGFYYKPRIDYKTLEEYSDGLICLSACLAGDIPQAILKRDYQEAERLVQWFKRVFGEDFYLEMQDHNMEEQKEVNAKLRELAKKYNVKLVATNDVHYIYKEDAEVHDVLMCVQMQKTFDDPTRMRFPSDEFYLKNYDEMARLFPHDLEALDVTVEIANKCNVDFEFGKYLFPRYIPEDGSTPNEFFRKLIRQGLIKRYGEITKEIEARAQTEIELIETQGFVEYFLVVWDYIDKARSMGIPVGPGRGSGAGSVVAYSLGITNIDPLKYDLLFERFIHAERVSAPDFDVDFADYRREEVIDYVKEKYTTDRVVKIATFGTMAAKNAIKDVGRVLKVPYSELDKVTKAIPNKVSKPEVIKKCFGLYKAKEGTKDYGIDYSIPELKEMYANNEDVKRVIDIAIKLEDMPRQVSTHACGVVIGADDLDKFMPLSRNGDDITTQFNMIEIERLGHLKMDFLGLRNLSDIEKTLQLIKENHGKEIDFENSSYDDPEVFKLISTGNTKAIFQIESSGFQKFMRELQPTNIEDIIAGVSLYRPGPMDSIPTYVHNKHNPKDVKYDHPILEPILKVTYGCIVYQEQVMRIVQDMAGYTLGQADMVRRMMGKKRQDEMAKEKSVFLYGKPAEDGKPAIDGAIKRGVPEDVATKIWSQMETFASYAFNKSHAAAYSLITYQTAFLKCYYKAEFLTSVLNNRITNADEVKNYVTYAKEEKIEVLPPDINQSQTYFSVDGGSIRFGLAALKNVGIGAVDAIINERKTNGEYKDLADFISRLDGQHLNKRCIESMILSGACDCFGLKRSQMMQMFPLIVDIVAQDRKQRASGQLDIFGMLGEEKRINVDVPSIAEYDEQVKLKLEKEVVGVYVSGHPLSDYVDMFNNFNLTADMIYQEVNNNNNVNGDYGEEAQVELEHLTDGMAVTCGGIVAEVKKVMTRATNKEMAILKIEDLYGVIEVMCFPQIYARFKELLANDALLTISGKLSIREGEAPIVLADKITLFDERNNQPQAPKQPVKTEKLCLKFDTKDKELYKDILEVLENYFGTSEVFVNCSSSAKWYKVPKRVDLKSNLQAELLAYLDTENIQIKK